MKFYIIFLFIFTNNVYANCLSDLDFEIKNQLNMKSFSDQLTITNKSNKAIVIWEIGIYNNKGQKMETIIGRLIEPFNLDIYALSKGNLATKLIKYYEISCFNWSDKIKKTELNYRYKFDTTGILKIKIYRPKSLR